MSGHAGMHAYMKDAALKRERAVQAAQRRINQEPNAWRDYVATLPTNSGERKAIPLTTGVLDYFPAALAEVAKVSKAGNDKHNPGEPMHHARNKSTDHADSIGRHLLERGKIDPDTGQRHSAELAWRALANLQEELEDAGLAPLPRGAKLPDPENKDKYDQERAPTPSEVAYSKAGGKMMLPSEKEEAQRDPVLGADPRVTWGGGPDYTTGDHVG